MLGASHNRAIRGKGPCSHDIARIIESAIKLPQIAKGAGGFFSSCALSATRYPGHAALNSVEQGPTGRAAAHWAGGFGNRAENLCCRGMN